MLLPYVIFVSCCASDEVLQGSHSYLQILLKVVLAVVTSGNCEYVVVVSPAIFLEIIKIKINETPVYYYYLRLIFVSRTFKWLHLLPVLVLIYTDFFLSLRPRFSLSRFSHYCDVKY